MCTLQFTASASTHTRTRTKPNSGSSSWQQYDGVGRCRPPLRYSTDSLRQNAAAVARKINKYNHSTVECMAVHIMWVCVCVCLSSSHRRFLLFDGRHRCRAPEPFQNRDANTDTSTRSHSGDAARTSCEWWAVGGWRKPNTLADWPSVTGAALKRVHALREAGRQHENINAKNSVCTSLSCVCVSGRWRRWRR